MENRFLLHTYLLNHNIFLKKKSLREQFAKYVILRETGIRFPLKNENYWDRQKSIPKRWRISFHGKLNSETKTFFCQNLVIYFKKGSTSGTY